MTLQMDRPAVRRLLSDRGADTAKTLLAAGGVLAAFGVASCCALPIALSLLGIGSASLVAIGYFTAQYQQALFYIAAACLGAAAIIIVRQRRARTCAPGTACTSRVLDWVSRIALTLAIGLLSLTFWIEPPI